MANLYGKCGNNCGGCQLHVSHLVTEEDRVRVAEGLSRSLNWNPSPERLRACAGCQSTDIKAFLYLKNCRVRKCAQHNGVYTCAECSVFPCSEVPKVSVGSEYRANSEKRLGELLSEDEYLNFIEVYEGMKHLNELRETIPEKNWVQMKPVSVKHRVTVYPDELGEEYLEVFNLIEKLYKVDVVPYSLMPVVKRGRKELLKILYAFGLDGEPIEKGLMMSSETYYKHKLPSSLEKVNDFISELGKHGSHAEIIPSIEKYLTGTGALRQRGWTIHLKADSMLIEKLVKYVRALNVSYGKDGFRYFSRGDMKIMIENN